MLKWTTNFRSLERTTILSFDLSVGSISRFKASNSDYSVLHVNPLFTANSMASKADIDARSVEYKQRTKADLVRLLAHVLDEGDEAALKKLSKDDLINNLAVRMECPSGDIQQWIRDDQENKEAVMEDEADSAAEGDEEAEDDEADGKEAKPVKRSSKKHKAEAEPEPSVRKKARTDALEAKAPAKKKPFSLFASEAKAGDDSEESGESEPLVPLGTASCLMPRVVCCPIFLVWR